jgi:hypothetical protein
MPFSRLIDKLREWVSEGFTGVIQIHLHEGGIRKVRIERDVK